METFRISGTRVGSKFTPREPQPYELQLHLKSEEASISLSLKEGLWQPPAFWIHAEFPRKNCEL
jgi:hypothetical protein